MKINSSPSLLAQFHPKKAMHEPAPVLPFQPKKS